MYISVPTCSMFVDTYISHRHACKHFNQRELIEQPDHKQNTSFLLIYNKEQINE